MARIFITGSADGLGQLAAKKLIRKNHEVVLHARSEERGVHALKQIPGAADVLVADLSSIEETRKLAAKANASGGFDAVIHNAGIYRVPQGGVGAEGLPLLLTVNTLAPYILTCMMNKPERLIYLSSGMHLQGDPGLNGHVSYSDTKLHDLILALAVAQQWPGVYSNAVNPGWVPTKMGGAGAPDDLEKGYATQVWLAESQEPPACVSGYYFFHQRHNRYLEIAGDPNVQSAFLARCEQLTGVAFPPG